MPESIHGSLSAEQAVRAGIAAAGRRRRVRVASARLWHAAPLVCAVALAAAAIGRWMYWPRPVPIALLLCGITALAIGAVLSRRSRPVSDTEASAIDADANLRGELRSAAWFAGRDRRDGFAELHLQRAAERIHAVNWAELYPPIPARRAQAVTLALLAGTLALAVTTPDRPLAEATLAAAARPAAQPARSGPQALDPELQQLLAELLAQAADGRLPNARALANDDEMRSLLDKLNTMTDQELLEALKQALAAHPDIEAAAAAQNLTTLTADARKIASAGEIPKETLEALEKLSEDVEIVKLEEEASGELAEAGSTGAEQGQLGQRNDAGASEELSIQFAAQADAAAAAGMVMMPDQELAQQSGGPPGAGTGGAGSSDAAATGPGLEAVLKQESVEASQDSAGENVETEIRRRTEHGEAAVAFTRSAAGAFDRTRAVAPPRVPEARRPGVQTYFVRKP